LTEETVCRTFHQRRSQARVRRKLPLRQKTEVSPQNNPELI